MTILGSPLVKKT